MFDTFQWLSGGSAFSSFISPSRLRQLIQSSFVITWELWCRTFVWWIQIKCLQQAPKSRHKYAALNRIGAETRHSVRCVNHSRSTPNRFLIIVEMLVKMRKVTLKCKFVSPKNFMAKNKSPPKNVFENISKNEFAKRGIWVLIYFMCPISPYVSQLHFMCPILTLCPIEFWCFFLTRIFIEKTRF